MATPRQARALVDSVLGAAKEGSPAYVDALFARASIAESADAARKDYLRIAVDYSISPRAEDALLRLAQMEIARGDRAAAKQYLDRLALEHPDGASRAQGAYWLGRVLLDDGALMRRRARRSPKRKRTWRRRMSSSRIRSPTTRGRAPRCSMRPIPRAPIRSTK